LARLRGLERFKNTVAIRGGRRKGSGLFGFWRRFGFRRRQGYGGTSSYKVFKYAPSLSLAKNPKILAPNGRTIF
jgi:hypothetical protein